MVNVIFKDGEFLIKGTFSMGIAGVNENKEYGDECIYFESGFEELAEDLESDEYAWITPLKPYFVGVPKDGDSYAKVLEKYINDKEAKIQENIKQINDYFIYRLIENFLACAYPFWETEEAVLPEFKDADEEFFEALYKNEELCEAIYALDKEFYEMPNDGSMVKTDVEALARKWFPMFNWDGLIQTIIPEGISFDGAWMSVGFSDSWGYNFYCSAYEKFDENMTPRDWHNF